MVDGHVLTQIFEPKKDKNNKNIDPFSYLENTIIDTPKISGDIESALITSDKYHESFNLYEDTVADELLGVCLFKDKESVNKPLRLEKLINIFINNNVFKLTGLTLKDFMELNVVEMELLIDVCVSANEKRNTIVEDALEE